MQLLLVTSVWALASWLLTTSIIGMETQKRHEERFEAALRSLPPLFAAACAYLLLAHFAPAWSLAAPAVGLLLAALCWAKPSGAVVAHALLVTALLASPWLGPAEPQLGFRGTVIGGSRGPTPARIILFSVDTLRARDLGFLGGTAVPTPGFDRLASDSVVFERAYSTSGWTLSSFSSLLLGVSPWVHGAWSQFDRPSDAPRSLGERFSESGYRTAKMTHNMFLTEAMTGPALTQGFELVDDPPSNSRPRSRAFEFLWVRSFLDLGEKRTTDDLFDWAESFLDHNRDEPFFLWLHILDPHQPYVPKAAFVLDGDPVDWGDPDTDPKIRPKTAEQVAHMQSLYRAEIAWVDARLNRFLDRLRELGLYDDALIAFVSDHGEEFLEHGGFSHGHTLYNELLHVPLTFKLPHSAKKGRIAERVSTLSFAPTLLELAGTPYDPADFSAKPLSIDGEPSSAPLFAAGNPSIEAREAVIFGRYKLIRMRDFGMPRLYDLDADPQELYNVAGEHPDEVAHGLSLLLEHAESSRLLRQRLGVADTGPSNFDESEKEMLRSLGYIQ